MNETSIEEKAAQLARQYAVHCRDYRDDLVFELMMKFGLNEDEAEELFDEAINKGGHYVD